MKIGTKSVLFGAHCFCLHPFFVARGWFRLYGWRVAPLHANWRLSAEKRERASIAFWHPWLWIAFFVHDIGYIGKPNMDGPEGEEHPWTGASILYWLQGAWLFLRQPVFYSVKYRLFDSLRWWHFGRRWAHAHLGVSQQPVIWGNEALYHSRFLAKRYNTPPSQLCMADKLAFPLTPRWLYLPMVRATGEIHEYMAKADKMNRTGSKYDGMHHPRATQEEWWNDVAAYVTKWVYTHKDGRDDTWTSANGDRRPIAASGVHQ